MRLSQCHDFVIIRSYLGGGQLLEIKHSRCDMSSGKLSERRLVFHSASLALRRCVVCLVLFVPLHKYRCDTHT